MSKLVYSFHDYINSPAGKGSAISKVDQDTYNRELYGLEQSRGKISYTIYKIGRTDLPTYYFHFRVPASVEGVYNDVVIQLSAPRDDNPSVDNINNYKVKFFANDASFVFTYAYTYKIHGLLISDLEKKLPIRSILQKPGTRNPDNAMGHSKNIYFCYLVMMREGLFSKVTINSKRLETNINKLKSSILDYSKKEEERKRIINDKKLSKTNKNDSNDNIDSPDIKSNFVGSAVKYVTKAVKILPITKVRKVKRKK